jgi:hypothetical protein
MDNNLFLYTIYIKKLYNLNTILFSVKYNLTFYNILIKIKVQIKIKVK